MHREFHVTVSGDPFQWQGFCAKEGIKPLWIELNNFERQLMCASPTDPTKIIEKAGWNILRIKEEVEAVADVEVPGALYYECHMKFDGRFRPEFKKTSRDLYREHRWYATHRQTTPFDPNIFVRIMEEFIGQQSHFDSFEYEAAVVDTNPGLDARWR